MRCLHAGESHGPALVSIIEGFPSGLKLDAADFDEDMSRRLEGYGRGLRASTIETDRVQIPAGLWKGRTMGSPLALMIENADHGLRKGKAHPDWSAPRPGHADLAGRIRYGYDEFAPVAERASARSTAGVVAVGVCAKYLLKNFGIQVWSHTAALGGIDAHGGEPTQVRLRRIRSGTPLRCLDRKAAAAMITAIDEAHRRGVTLGGVSEVVAFGLPVGLGTYAQPDRRLDARLAEAVMAIPSVKAVEIGDGVAITAVDGQHAHDALYPAAGRSIRRETNRAGGLEGGVSNGMPLRIRAFVKPISSQRKGVPSVDMSTGKPAKASYVRSDTCVVPAAGVVAEAAVAWELAVELVRALGEAPLKIMKQRFKDMK